MMGKTRSIRDPIHGFVELDATEWKIVNSRPFQRLRDIRQLGMGHMVYPGANHTRFEHSIGCMHVATRMFERLCVSTDSSSRLFSMLGQQPEERLTHLKRLVRLGALLHDVGHAPFSHAGEDMFVPASVDLSAMSEAERTTKLKMYSHEHATAAIIRSDLVAPILCSANLDPEHVIWVATDSKRANTSDLFAHQELDIANQLLTGELGADRCDYLLRDSHHSGQPAGWFDLERLIQQTALVEFEGADYLGLMEGGAIAAEQMVANRYAAYINLYFHKAKRAFEKHLALFMESWLPNGRLSSNPDEFVELSDSRVIAAIQDAGADKSCASHKLALPFRSRDHYRVAFERFPADLRLQPSGNEAGSLPPEKWQEFSKLVREKYGQDVFVDVCSHSATKLRQAQHRVLVQMRDRVRTLDSLSEIVRGMEEKIWRLRVHASAELVSEVRQFSANLWTRLATHGEKQ